MNDPVVIGIDTSNYTTSVSAVSSCYDVISDRRKLLEVKAGERGLRQQEALFQHVNNLPELYRQVIEDISGHDIAGVACSTRPRPVEGSYMPCFNAGHSFAEVIASSFGCPLYTFSHQEGHVNAAAKGTPLDSADDFVFFHLSGGTTEALTYPGYELVGRTLDISFGQLIDRVGVALHMGFPCGAEMDRLAISCHFQKAYELPKIKVSDGNVNLSGIETHCQRIIKNNSNIDRALLCVNLFDRITDALVRMIKDINKSTGESRFLLAGGVSSSQYIRENIKEAAPDNIEICFGKPELSCDNSIGIAILGGREIWR